MSGKIIELTPRPEPIGHFIRIGGNGHRQLETLQGSGKLQLDRVVADAASFKAQKDLLGSLRNSGTEITLDTRIAELSEVGSYVQSAQWLSCVERSRPLIPADFAGDRSDRIVAEIAEFAIRNAFDAVLAPSHFVTDARNPWWPIDIKLCQHLRRALDQMGGAHVRIDYPLITTYRSLREPEQRRAFIAVMNDLPYSNLWLRISGFGADATGIAVRRSISAIADLHSIRRPIVADHVGGLVGLALVAFGATGAVAHGVAEKERFAGQQWLSPKPKGGGGHVGRIYIRALDRYFKIDDAQQLMELGSARRLLACADRDCCPLGVEDTFKNPKGHFLTQRSSQLADLSRIHESRRVDRFLNHHLAQAARIARQAARLSPNSPSLARVLLENTVRIDLMRAILEDLQQTIGHDYSRSRAPRRQDQLGGEKDGMGRR